MLFVGFHFAIALPFIIKMLYGKTPPYHRKDCCLLLQDFSLRHCQGIVESKREIATNATHSHNDKRKTILIIPPLSLKFLSFKFSPLSFHPQILS